MYGNWPYSIAQRGGVVPAPRGRDRKEDRLEIRASSRESALIRRAAEAAAKTVSAFVLEAAFVEAQRTLADRRLFLLDAGRWERFVKALDRPAREKPRLRKLMGRRTVLD